MVGGPGMPIKPFKKPSAKPTNTNPNPNSLQIVLSSSCCTLDPSFSKATSFSGCLVWARTSPESLKMEISRNSKLSPMRRAARVFACSCACNRQKDPSMVPGKHSIESINKLRQNRDVCRATVRNISGEFVISKTMPSSTIRKAFRKPGATWNSPHKL